ncbi:hypothetical protein C817_01164 [Dorea sp. 5-2]|nr:hypothetical protein C817_01164 [Dorea sp. 5-2]
MDHIYTIRMPYLICLIHALHDIPRLPALYIQNQPAVLGSVPPPIFSFYSHPIHPNSFSVLLRISSTFPSACRYFEGSCPQSPQCHQTRLSPRHSLRDPCPSRSGIFLSDWKPEPLISLPRKAIILKDARLPLELLNLKKAVARRKILTTAPQILAHLPAKIIPLNNRYYNP